MSLSLSSGLASPARPPRALRNLQSGIFWPAVAGLMLILAQPAPARAAPFFDSGAPDGKMAMASRPANNGKIEIEAADDFILSVNTAINSVTFTGLLVGASPTVGQVRIEIYRVFPLDSNNP